ncbi:UNVERIFIED_CONTAM: hypothetical protein FKN15_051503 [Acipenser sinensis]
MNWTLAKVLCVATFILQSKEVIHNQLLEKQKGADEKIKELETCCSVPVGQRLNRIPYMDRVEAAPLLNPGTYQLFNQPVTLLSVKMRDQTVLTQTGRKTPI